QEPAHWGLSRQNWQGYSAEAASVRTPCGWSWPWLGSRCPHILFQEVQALWAVGHSAFTKYLSSMIGSFVQSGSASTTVAGLASGSALSGSLPLFFPLPIQRGIHRGSDKALGSIKREVTPRRTILTFWVGFHRPAGSSLF
ncbi:unnamed protein product, partial [Gulo gulo]